MCSLCSHIKNQQFMVNRIPICQAHAQIPSHTQNIQGSNGQCPGRVMRVGRLTSGKKMINFYPKPQNI